MDEDAAPQSSRRQDLRRLLGDVTPLLRLPDVLDRMGRQRQLVNIFSEKQNES